MKYTVPWSDDNGNVTYTDVDVVVARDGKRVTMNIVRPEWRVGRRDYALRLVVNTLMRARLMSRLIVRDDLAGTGLTLHRDSGIMGQMYAKRGVSNPGWTVSIPLHPKPLTKG